MTYPHIEAVSHHELPLFLVLKMFIFFLSDSLPIALQYSLLNLLGFL